MDERVHMRPFYKSGQIVARAVCALIMATVVQRATGQRVVADDIQQLRAAGNRGGKPATSGLSRYYYQRGQRVIWRDDFRQYMAGAFPRQMELVNGHFEVKNIKGRNYLWTVSGGILDLNLPESLPQLFSIEIEYDSPEARLPFLFTTGVHPSGLTCSFGSLNHASFLECSGYKKFVMANLPDAGRIHPRFTVDGEHVSGYINEQLLPPLPDARIARGKRVRLQVPGGTPERPTLITVINIAEGGSRSAVESQ